MLNLLLALAAAPVTAAERHEDEGFLGKIALWAWQRTRYLGALARLRQLDNDDLDEVGIGRADFPELAWRHAVGAAPLERPYR